MDDLIAGIYGMDCPKIPKRNYVKVAFDCSDAFLDMNITGLKDEGIHVDICQGFANMQLMDIEEIITPLAGVNPQDDVCKKADENIAKIINNGIFLLHPKHAKDLFKTNKGCNVCMEIFECVGDLKKHLVEHIIKSTLAKTPFDCNGTLTIQCVVCKTATFNNIDKYKSHIRLHAKLMKFSCSLCNKSFSDAVTCQSHKKTHFLRPRSERISRKLTFNDDENEKALNFQCRYCTEHFKNTKGRRDHEWKVHRKIFWKK